MKHASQSEFGRPVTAVRGSAGPDKWEILKALTEAAPDFGLGHRSLNVLRALLSFLPGTEIAPDPGAATVFPSNRTLSARLSGMPESTLRRHLARLVQLGVVNRHDSPNRKRYARHSGPGVALAFGFDLSPLAVHAERIHAAAQASRDRAQAVRILRDRIAKLRMTLIDRAGAAVPETLLDQVRKILRRKPDFAALNRIHDALSAEIARHAAPRTGRESVLAAVEPSASDSQNERHIQDSDKTDSDSETGRAQICHPDPSQTPIVSRPKAAKDAGMPLARFLGVCTELNALFPDPIGDWPALVRTSDRVAPMLGIDAPVVAQAQRAMGVRQAALAIICILERNASIRRPGAYLRRLAQKAETGPFSVVPMMNGLAARGNPEIVS